MEPDSNAPKLTLDTHALFLDFDGTLAPLQDDPDTVDLPEFGAETLFRLQAKLAGAIVLISGRDIRDLSSRTPIELMRAGGHGLEICAPGEAPPSFPDPISPDILAQVAAITDLFEGVRIEEKGPVLAIHFRQNPEAETQLVTKLMALAETIDGYKAQHGKMVIELKPLRANKGTALRSIMNTETFADRIPVMVGDDVTDEDAMRTAIELGGYGIKVGPGTTLAEYRFDDPKGVWAWLRSIIDEHT
ncbi:MAG: trehalose-phosphatase [Pseudomonadota bacterium]